MRYKIIIPLLLIASLLFCACGQKETQMQVHFYYCRKDIEYDQVNGAIGYELCSNPLDHSAYGKYFSNYLSGPKTKDLVSPFPAGTELISISVEQQTVHIVLNDSFAELTGIELSIACACISLTAKEMTGCANVEISTQNALLDNQRTIVINTNTLQLSDQIHP